MTIPDFLAAVAETRVPLLREYGHELTGLYEVMSNQHEVVVVWATDIPSQSDRTIVITGANSGIGLVAARELAGAGARVVLAVRDTAKGSTAADTVMK